MHVNGGHFDNAVLRILRIKNLVRPFDIHAEFGFLDAGGNVLVRIVFNIRIDPQSRFGFFAVFFAKLQSGFPVRPRTRY